MEQSSNSSNLKKGFSKGVILIEVQKGMFQHPHLIERLKLSEPYVKTSVYTDSNRKITSDVLVKKDNCLESYPTNPATNPN